MPTKRYDRAYFDRWYRDPHNRVGTSADVRRKVAMVLGIAEHLLGARVATVLDIGAGEGAWYPHVHALRPRAHYAGVDSSEYAVRRYGKRRHLRLGSFGHLDELGLDGPWDLVVCCDVLHYVPAPELRSGLAWIAGRTSFAYLEAYTADDEVLGDMQGWQDRPATFYRKAFARAGFVPIGMHCYVTEELAEMLVSLEKTGSRQ